MNLKERYGKRYRVRHEKSYKAQYGPRAWTPDTWLQIIPCRHGHIYPHGGDVLAAATDKAGGMARRLKALDFATVHQDGTDGVTVLFPIERFDEVAEIMQPKRRRRLSPEARKAAGERLAKYRLEHAVGTRPEAQFCVGRG